MQPKVLTNSRLTDSLTQRQPLLNRLLEKRSSRLQVPTRPVCDCRVATRGGRGACAAAPTAQAIASSETALASYGVRPAALPSAADVVLRFIDALNARDLSSLLTLLADDCHHEDLAHEGQARSKEEVARFYSDLVSSMPEKVQVVVDDITAGDPVKVGLIWHMEVDGVEVPCSRGLSFYRVSRAGAGAGGGAGSLISYVRQSPEHFIKLSGVVLSATASATPLIDSLGPMALPGFWFNLARGASSMLASAPPMEEVLRNLAAAGATNTVPSMADLMGGVAAAAAAAAATSGGGSAGAFGAHRSGGEGGGSVQSGSFTSVAMSEAPGASARGGGVHRTSQAYTRAAYPGAASKPHPRLSPPHAEAAVQPAAAAAPQPTSDAGAAPARASPVVFAASVAVTERPFPTIDATASTGRGPGGILADAGLMYGSAGSVDFDLAQMSASAAAYGQPSSASIVTATATAVSGKPVSDSAAAAPEQVQPPPPAPDEVPAAVASAAASSPAVPMSSLAGIWEKDLEASDVAGYEEALDLWQISGVHKATARLIEGLELAVGDSGRGGGGGGAFNVHFLTIIPYFKVTESYPLGGGRAKMRRRDQRAGDSQAHAEALPNGVLCRAAWGAPFAGVLEESYTLPDPAGRPDVLHVKSTIRVGGKEATTAQVYHRRRNMSARDLLSASEKRNGKANDVLKRFGL